MVTITKGRLRKGGCSEHGRWRFTRIGGGSVDNLRLTPRDAELNPPGISVLKAPSPAEAARQIRAAFPDADRIREAAEVVGSTTQEKISQAGFGVIPNPSRRLPNHHRIIHSDGVSGFNDDNLRRLSQAFDDTSEN